MTLSRSTKPKKTNTYADRAANRKAKQQSVAITQPGRPRDTTESGIPTAPASPGKHRPDHISPRAWGLAEQWIEMGRDVLGQRPHVSQEKFAQRLQETIHARFDKGPNDILTIKGPDYIDDLVTRMIRIFWLDGSRPSSGVVQFAFLSDEWDDLIDRAATDKQVEWVKSHGSFAPRTEPDPEAQQKVRKADEARRIARYLDSEPEAVSESRERNPSLLDRFRND